MFPPPSIVSPGRAAIDPAGPRERSHDHHDAATVAADRRSSLRNLVRSVGPAAVGVALATVWVAPGAPLEARITLTVFIAAIVLWTATELDDALVALGAAATATLVSGADVDDFHASLGSATAWLLVASFVIAAAVQASGLAVRAVSALLRSATTVSSLFWRITLGLGLMSFAIPATSGRAALALPVFAALHARIDDARIRRGLALLFPTIVLLSASASLLGAGAHLVAMDLVETAGGSELGFVRWAALALPFTALSCAAATTTILHLFLDADRRGRPVSTGLRTGVSLGLADDAGATPVDLVARRRRVGPTLGVVLVAWCSTGLHELEPSIVAVLGAVVVCLPGRGGIRLADAIADVPWSLVLFLASTTALGAALVSSGAADWLGGSALRHADRLPVALVVIAVVLVSLLAHLVIGSRSARAGVLVPLVIALATSTGLDMTALVFASSMAAGYCLTLTVSAKPVAMFEFPFGPRMPAAYEGRDLLQLSGVLIPVHLALVTFCSLVMWPLLGLPL